MTAWSLGALALGLGLGMALHGSDAAWVESAAGVLAPVGQIWVRVLSLVVIPLIISLAVVAVLQTPDIGRLGGKALALFGAMLATAGLLTVLIAPPIISLYRPDPETIAALRASIAVPDAAQAALGTRLGLTDWLRGYLPASLDSALRGADVLVLLLGAMILALLVRTFPGPRRAAVERVFQRVADATRLVVRWILVITPAGVFALSFGMALNAGGGAAGFMLASVLIVCGILLLFTLLLYPATALLGSTSIRRFARAAAPAQLVAVSSQSSLASLPALVEGGREALRLPVAATGFVLPLAVSIFKLNRTISAPVQLLLLTHAFDVSLDPARLPLFMGTVFLQSFFTPGIPGGSTPFWTLPLYVSAGAPIEGVVILAAIEPITDMFKTLINVTGDLSAATILSRRPAAGPGA